MDKVWLAPYDFVQRDPTELSFSKYDLIRISFMDQGWCWGCNLSQHGKEGWFPKIYANYSRANSSVLDRVVLETASVCSRIDSLIADSAYLVSDDDRLLLRSRENTLSTIGPFTYLVSPTATNIWEAAFRNFLGAFEDKKVHKLDYIILIGRFKHLANELDKHATNLGDEVRKHPTIRPSLLDNALQMQTTLRSLLEIASLVLEASKAANTTTTTQGTGWSLAPTLTPTRTPKMTTMTSLNSPAMDEGRVSPLPRRGTVETVILGPPVPPARPAIYTTLLGYQALRNLTFLVSLAACALQFQAYTVYGDGKNSGGGIDSPDFFNNLQTFLMQLLTTYTGLAPAVRDRHHNHPHYRGGSLPLLPLTGPAPGLPLSLLRGHHSEDGTRTQLSSSSPSSSTSSHFASAFWAAFLFVACVVLNVASVGVFFAHPALAQLLSFFGAVVQAITVLQLTLRVDETAVIVVDGSGGGGGGGGDGGDVDNGAAGGRRLVGLPDG